MYIEQYYGGGSGPFWLDNLRCTGNERSLAECGHTGWGVHNCRNYRRRDVSIVCSNSAYKQLSSILHIGINIRPVV